MWRPRIEVSVSCSCRTQESRRAREQSVYLRERAGRYHGMLPAEEQATGGAASSQSANMTCTERGPANQQVAV